MNDIVLKAQAASGKTQPELSYAEVLNIYKSICEHRLLMSEAHATSAV